MEKRRLGNSDLVLSVLGLGCWQFGGGSYWGEQSQNDVEKVVHGALDQGINYFDTAEVYNDGDSERSLGAALKGRREQAVIGSKVTTANLFPTQIRSSCEASLERLQTDYIDLYMVHWPIHIKSVAHFVSEGRRVEQLPNLIEAFEELRQLQKEGKIRHIGISNHGVLQMREVMAADVPVAANELAYNLLSRAIEEAIIPYCTEHRIGIIGYMPLQQGLLTGKYRELNQIGPMQARSRHFHHSRGEGTRHGEEGAEEEILQALQGIRKLAEELGVSMAALSLAWVMANPAVTTTIAGCRNEEQLRSNLQGAELCLESSAIRRLNEMTEPVLKKLGNNPDYYENRNDSRIR